MSPATQAAFEAIREAAAAGQTRIAPCTFSPFFGRAATAAAFRMARRECVIEVAYVSCVGTAVYRAVWGRGGRERSGQRLKKSKEKS